MDVDDIFESAHKSWRDRVKGDALELCEAVEARMEAGEKPSWITLAARLHALGVEAALTTISGHYLKKYPHLRDAD